LLLKLGVLTPFLESPRSMHPTAPQFQFAGYWRPQGLLSAAVPSRRDFAETKVALRGQMQAVDYRPGSAISNNAISLEFYKHLVDDRKHPFITELDPQDDILGTMCNHIVSVLKCRNFDADPYMCKCVHAGVHV
jgi:hypothetical protein